MSQSNDDENKKKTPKKTAVKKSPTAAKPSTSSKTSTVKTPAKKTATSSKTTSVKKTTTKSAPSKTRKANKQSTPVNNPDKPWLKSYPNHVTWDITIPTAPAWKLLDDSVRDFPHSTCINFLGKKYSYEQIGYLSNLVAKGLQDQGLQKGDRVGIFMPNAVYYVIFYYGILKAGGVVVNYNPLYANDELLHQINDSDTEIMVTLDLEMLYTKVHHQLNLSKLKKIIVCSVADSLPFPKNYLFRLFKRKDIAKVQYNKDIISFDDLTHNNGKYHPIDINPEKDIALLQYTGGTTGVPKGAMLSHQNILSNAYQALSWLPKVDPGQEKILAGLPLFHVYAMTAVMTLANRLGSEIVMMFPRFDAGEAIRLIEKHKITFFPAVPTMYNLISNHPNTKNADLSSIKCCLSGGAALPLQVKLDFERVSNSTVVEAYGLSETSPAATAIPINGVYKEGSIGLPFPQTDVKIFSLDTKNPNEMKEVPLGTKGQIAIKGPQVMLGYWNKEKETKSSFKDDYFLTGDAGYMDEDGYIFLVDRIKDLIICSGFNVYPRHVEEAIYKFPKVNEVTVIGIPDEKRGESVKAFIKLKEDQSSTYEEILDFLKDKLSPIEMPKEIEFRKELPKTVIGKLSKKELRQETQK